MFWMVDLHLQVKDQERVLVPPASLSCRLLSQHGGGLAAGLVFCGDSRTFLPFLLV